MRSEDFSRAELLETREIGIAGMTGDTSAREIEKALRSVRGVKAVHVDRQAASAAVTFSPADTNVPALYGALLQSGYQPTTGLRE